jgi:hypothetical protein
MAPDEEKPEAAVAPDDGKLEDVEMGGVAGGMPLEPPDDFG